MLSTLQYMAFILPEKHSNHNFTEVFIIAVEYKQNF